MIDELEALLLQKERSAELTSQEPEPSIDKAFHHTEHSPSLAPPEEFSTFPSAMSGNAPALVPTPYQDGTGSDTLSSGASQSHSPSNNMYMSMSPNNNTTNASSGTSTFGLDIVWPNWPLHLPGPELLRHL